MAIQTSKTTSQVGIFVPEKFRARPQVDLVVYLHGLLGPCGSPTNGMAGYWDTGLARPGQHPGTGPMALRESLNASRKSAILVAPSLGRGSEAGALTSRGGFDALVDKTLEAVGRDSHLAVKPTSVGQIVLSGHSKGGSHMRRIVAAGDSMAERIRECWGFDCMYGGADPEAWKAWAAADTKRRRFFHYYLVGRDKKGNKLVPWYHNEILRGLAKDAGLRNVTLEHAQGFNHCQVPMAYFRKRLEESDFLDNA
jgi:hypothetical protein